MNPQTFVKTHALSLARLCSFMALLFLFIGIYAAFTLYKYLPFASNLFITLIYNLGFPGTALCIILCPLFLPSPRRARPLAHSLVFIVLVILPVIIIQFLGSGFWLDSRPIMLIWVIIWGIFFPIHYGIFFLAWQNKNYRNLPPLAGQKSRLRPLKHPSNSPARIRRATQ